GSGYASKHSEGVLNAAHAFAAAAGTDPAAAARTAAGFAEDAIPDSRPWRLRRREQALILRDIFGNPFRPVAVDPRWLAWHDGAVKKLARSVYDRRRFADLPVLADALEEA